jgi:RimJ/RimL family protein N-acetyltransferase
MPVRILPTELSHVPGFNAAVDAVARERRYIALLEGPPISGSETFVRSILSGAGAQVVAVDDQQHVVGWCDIVRMRLEGFHHRGHLGMGLLPPYRGRGLGRELAVATIERAKRMGMERIELEVFASNTLAIRLYERLGFIHEGVKRRARLVDGKYDDCVQMALLPAG